MCVIFWRLWSLVKFWLRFYFCSFLIYLTYTNSLPYYYYYYYYLTQCLEATSPRLPHDKRAHDNANHCHDDDTLTLLDTTLAQIRKMPPCGKIWIPNKHISIIHTTLYLKLKSYQLRSNRFPKYHSQSQSSFALVHSSHWTEKTCELPHIDP